MSGFEELLSVNYKLDDIYERSKELAKEIHIIFGHMELEKIEELTAPNENCVIFIKNKQNINFIEYDKACNLVDIENKYYDNSVIFELIRDRFDQIRNIKYIPYYENIETNNKKRKLDESDDIHRNKKTRFEQVDSDDSDYEFEESDDEFEESDDESEKSNVIENEDNNVERQTSFGAKCCSGNVEIENCNRREYYKKHWKHYRKSTVKDFINEYVCRFSSIKKSSLKTNFSIWFKRNAKYPYIDQAVDTFREEVNNGTCKVPIKNNISKQHNKNKKHRNLKTIENNKRKNVLISYYLKIYNDYWAVEGLTETGFVEKYYEYNHNDKKERGCVMTNFNNFKLFKSCTQEAIDAITKFAIENNIQINL